VASSGSDLRTLGARLATLLGWSQAIVVLCVATGLAFRAVGGSPVPLELIGVTVLVASPFVVTAAVALTAERHRGRLIVFAMSTLALAAIGVALAA
jgi:heme/copper-type cytochrome/quinol oxidase subunit 3